MMKQIEIVSAMKRNMRWLMGALLICGLWMFVACANEDSALETAPYYAVCVTPAIHHTMGGLSVNTDTQVLKADGTPIPGLYAAGEVTGGLHGANRLGGNGVADIVVNGRLAGIAAAQKALK